MSDELPHPPPPLFLPLNRDPAFAIEQAIRVLNTIIERHPEVRRDFDCEAFIHHELVLALEEIRMLRPKAAPSDIPPPPPGITLLSPQEFLGRRDAPSKTPKTDTFYYDKRGEVPVLRERSIHENIEFARQLERARNAWEAKFNAECEKHDVTTLRAMKAERDLSAAIALLRDVDRHLNIVATERDVVTRNSAFDAIREAVAEFLERCKPQKDEPK